MVDCSSCSRTRWCGLVLLASLCGVIGCGDASPFDYAPVTGTVLLDGDPLAEARVVFMPRASGDSLVAGPRSMGVTDSSGRFELTAHKGPKGAVVGSHGVRIMTYREELVGENFKVVAKERVPQRYNVRSKLTRDVPAEGLSDCTFELTSD